MKLPDKYVLNICRSNALLKWSRIQCSRCDTWKTQTAYAKNRLQKLVSPYNPNQSKNQRDMKNIRIPCINCTGMQASEIECIQCGKKKSVEYFSGQQRKQPDMAVCIHIVPALCSFS